MKRHFLKEGFVVFLLIFLLGCTPFQLEEEAQKNTQPTPPKEANEHETNKISLKVKDSALLDPIQRRIDKMSLDEKIAQMMFIGLKGTALSNSEQQLIQKQQVGGVILLGGNIQNRTQLFQYIKNIKKANKSNPTPLMLGVDEEGGRVSRIPNGIENFPSNQYIGNHASPELAHTIGELLAKKVETFGFNLNFAPVLDIFTNPNNRVIGDRAFGTTAQKVSEFGIATMKGIQSENVIPVIKHFPGHGNTSVDSHKSLPIVEESMVEIEQEELVPFQNAINQGADMVMVAHILYTAIDQQYPATLSKRVITDVLREEMGFEGVVITDDMSMGAITQNYGMEEAAVLSIAAGTDMFMLTSSGKGNYQKVKNALLEAVEQGTITEKSLNKSVKRILTLKKKYNLTHELPPEVDMSELNRKIRKVKEKFN